MFALDQLRDAELRELYEYWLARPREDRLPRRGGKDPPEVAGLFRFIDMIGATGFEPVTFAPPVQCATGLRHAPMSPG